MSKHAASNTISSSHCTEASQRTDRTSQQKEGPEGLIAVIYLAGLGLLGDADCGAHNIVEGGVVSHGHGADGAADLRVVQLVPVQRLKCLIVQQPHTVGARIIHPCMHKMFSVYSA